MSPGKVTLAGFLAVAAAGYLWLTDPQGIVVDQRGDISGPVNKARAAVQGDRFWEVQKDYAEHRLKTARDTLSTTEDPRAYLEKKIASAKDIADDVKSDYPDMQRHEARATVLKLRAMADAITEAEWRLEFFEDDKARAAELESTLSRISRELNR